MKNLKIILTSLLTLVYVLAIAQVDFITPKEFMKINDDKNVVTIDADKSKNYDVNHVKGAINIPHTEMYQEGDIEGLLLPDAELAKLLGDKGVSETNTIIVYDNGTQKYSTRVYWALKYLGAKDVKILHKDMGEWKKARVPLTRMATKAKAVTFTPNVDKTTLATIEDVRKGQNDDNVIIVDVRTPEEFDGSSDKSDGHIPGAININHKDFLTEDTEAFKSKEELETIAKQYGITPDKTLIFYCKTSIRGAVGYVVFKNILEYPNVKLYDGAYVEYKTKYDLAK